MTGGWEQDLREALRRQVGGQPALPGLADTVVHRGRRARRLRTAAVAAAGAAVLAVAAGALLVVPDRAPARFAGEQPSLEGPPRVPLSVQQGQGPALLDWPGGALRRRLTGPPPVVVGAVPSGVLLLDERLRLALLAPDADSPEPVLDERTTGSAAVHAAGRRASVVTETPGGRVLREVSLPDGDVLRSVVLAAPLVGDDEPLQAVAYSDGAVLLTAGEGAAQRALLWEPGDDQVVAALEGFTAARAGAAGRGAFEVADDRCRVEVVALRTGGGSWRLCREVFRAFSPGGERVLAGNAGGDGLVVHDADDGRVRRTFDVPGGVRASGWESSDALLYTTVEDGRTLLVRCSVPSGRCATAAALDDVGRIPEPVPPFGVAAG